MLFDKDLVQSTLSWYFVEIRKLLKEGKDSIKSKSSSNWLWSSPHIGTFGER